MSGQDAVNSAKAFNEQLELDGLILTKFELGHARRGAVVAKMITGKAGEVHRTGRSSRAGGVSA